jgi:hypothetical protein
VRAGGKAHTIGSELTQLVACLLSSAIWLSTSLHACSWKLLIPTTMMAVFFFFLASTYSKSLTWPKSKTRLPEPGLRRRAKSTGIPVRPPTYQQLALAPFP